MEPPSYDEARFHPPALSPDPSTVHPPPAYDAPPPTPPPTYGEAVTLQSNPFPVLTPPTIPTAATSPPQNNGVIIHPVSQIGVTRPVNTRQTQPAVVVTQPQPVPISVTYLKDSPGLVRCPHCQHVVTTKVTYVPGCGAWCFCVLLALMGLICGFCLIPLMVRSMQDAHHSCPRCETPLHVYKR